MNRREEICLIGILFRVFTTFRGWTQLQFSGSWFRSSRIIIAVTTRRACRFRPQFKQPDAVLVGHQDVFAVIEELQGLLDFERVICSCRREFFPSAIGHRHSRKWPGRVEPSVAEKKGTVERNDSPWTAKLWLELLPWRRGSQGVINRKKAVVNQIKKVQRACLLCCQNSCVHQPRPILPVHQPSG